MKKFLFVINFYNDVDHCSPLVFDLLDKGHSVGIIGLTAFPMPEDLRIRWLSKFQNFQIHKFKLMPRNKGISNQHSGAISFPKKLFREVVFNWLFALCFLILGKYDCVIFTWGRPRAKGFQRQLFKAAQTLGRLAICIPHGQNIYINYDVNHALREKFKATSKWPDFSDRDEFDAYVVQTDRHRIQHIEWGMNPEKVRAWGSLRFDPEWIRTNSRLYPDDNSPKTCETDELAVVFFLPHWRYNVDEDSCIELIQRIMDLRHIALQVKGHTRGDRLSPQTIKQLEQHSNCNLDSQFESTPLIDWADVVINFGSSIALEAVVKHLPVIYPSFLHDNVTIFDNCNYVFDCRNYEDVILLLREPHRLTVPSNTGDNSRRSLIGSDVFNQNDNSNGVPDVYSQHILKMLL